jgi:hypothetical protein
MIEFKKLLKEAQDVADEIRRLDLMERDANKVLKEVGSAGDIESTATQRKVADARIRLDLVASRRGYVESEHQRLYDALRAAYRAEASRWNILVAQAKNAMVEERISASLKYWEGDEKACRKYFDGLRMFEAPIFYTYNCAFCPEIPAYSDPIQAVKSLASHMERHRKILGWTEEQAARVPAAPRPGRPTGEEPKEILVRAIEDLPRPIAEQLALADRNKPRQKLAASAGKTFTLSIAQYRAWGRFFERVAA